MAIWYQVFLSNANNLPILFAVEYADCIPYQQSQSLAMDSNPKAWRQEPGGQGVYDLEVIVRWKCLHQHINKAVRRREKKWVAVWLMIE